MGALLFSGVRAATAAPSDPTRPQGDTHGLSDQPHHQDGRSHRRSPSADHCTRYGAYVPAANETFTLTLEDVSDY